MTHAVGPIRLHIVMADIIVCRGTTASTVSVRTPVVWFTPQTRSCRHCFLLLFHIRSVIAAGQREEYKACVAFGVEGRTSRMVAAPWHKPAFEIY